MKKKIKYEDLTELNGEPLPKLRDLKVVSPEDIGLPSAEEMKKMDSHIYERGKLVRVISGRGGARKGAGRRPSGRMQIVLRLKPSLIRSLRLQAKRERKSLSDIAERKLLVKKT